jgi:antitoxin MazE
MGDAAHGVRAGGVGRAWGVFSVETKSHLACNIWDIRDINLRKSTMHALEATLSSWGKSTALRIPAVFVKKSGLTVGQKVRVEHASDGSIVIRPVREKINLDALLAGVTPQNLPDEADVSWGKPVGSEVW